MESREHHPLGIAKREHRRDIQPFRYSSWKVEDDRDWPKDAAWQAHRLTDGFISLTCKKAPKRGQPSNQQQFEITELAR